MEKLKNRRILTALIGLAAVLIACLTVYFVTRPATVEGSKTVEVEVVHKDESSKTFTLHTDQEYLGRALVEGGVVEDNQSSYGLYILTADGETASEADQEWWCITKNGEMLETGADSTPIADGEHYELTLTVGW